MNSPGKEMVRLLEEAGWLVADDRHRMRLVLFRRFRIEQAVTEQEVCFEFNGEVVMSRFEEVRRQVIRSQRLAITVHEDYFPEPGKPDPEEMAVVMTARWLHAMAMRHIVPAAMDQAPGLCIPRMLNYNHKKASWE